MTLKKEMQDIKVQQALDEKVESDFVGDDIEMDEPLHEDVEKLIALAEANKPAKEKDSKKGSTTQAEKRNRLREVIEVSNRGFTYNEICEYGMRRWECSKRTVERYITEARKIEAIPESDLRDFRASSISRCLYLYKLAVKNKNESIALQAVKEYNKLLGLYPDQILSLQAGEENPVEKLIEEIKKGEMTEDDILQDAIQVDGETESDSDEEFTD